MTEKKIFLQGGGDHARVVLDSLLSQKVDVVGIFDPKYSGDLFGVPQLGAYQPELFPGVKSIIAIGDNVIRKKVVNGSKHEFVSLIDRTAIVSSRSIFGVGNMILHGAVVQARTKVGNHVIINTKSQVDHDCSIGDFVHIGPGAVLCGTVSVGEGSFIGAGAVLIPGVTVGNWSIVGAGSVVRKNIPDFTVVAGNPARIIRKITQ